MTSLILKLPDDVHRYLLTYQGAAKSERGTGVYSLSQSIISILREHKELMDSPDRSKVGESLNEDKKGD